MIRYKDFATGKPKFTRGRFVKWIFGGPLNAPLAVIELPRSMLFVPAYCLTAESRRELPPVPSSESVI